MKGTLNPRYYAGSSASEYSGSGPETNYDSMTPDDSPFYEAARMEVDQPSDYMGSQIRDSDGSTHGTGSQESQASSGVIRRCIDEEAAAFADLENEAQSRTRVGPEPRSRMPSQSESLSSQSQSQSSQEVSLEVLTQSPAQTLNLWISPNMEFGSRGLADENAPPSTPYSTLFGSSRKPSDGSAATEAHKRSPPLSLTLQTFPPNSYMSTILAQKQAILGGDGSIPTRKRLRFDQVNIGDSSAREFDSGADDEAGFASDESTGGSSRRQKRRRFSCPICSTTFTDKLSLARHRSAFKTSPLCLDLDAAPLTVYRCCMDVRGLCVDNYRDHRRDNVAKHEVNKHPTEHSHGACDPPATIKYDQVILQSLRDAAVQERL